VLSSRFFLVAVTPIVRNSRRLVSPDGAVRSRFVD
jgi:hypothetical protein